jgi:hypothetical protein
MNTTELTAFLLLLVALPLVSAGATLGIGLLWVTGIVVLALGGIIPVMLRFVRR